jgi:uncharacterized membrane protein YfcA
MDAQLLVGTLLIGAGVGFLSGAFGKGGSAISTPLLHLLGVPAIIAVASPLPATIPATILAARRYAPGGYINHRVLRFGLAVGIPATVAGALMTRWIPGGALVLATDVVLLVLALRILLRNDHREADDGTLLAADQEQVSRVRIVLVIATVGVVSGLLGNSGGFLLAPLFISALHMPVRHALGTSLAVAAVLAVPGTLVHAFLGHIDWTVTFVFALAAVPLASTGAATALKLRERTLTLAYGVGLPTLTAGLLVFAH